MHRGNGEGCREMLKRLAKEGGVETPMAGVKAKAEKEVHGEFGSECLGYCGVQDSFYIGNKNGVWQDRPADCDRHLHQAGVCQALRP